MINLRLLYKNPLSLQPIIAKKEGFFKKNNVKVNIEIIGHFPAFDMSKVTANVGDVTRIFERISAGEELIITSDLTRTMKLILIEGYENKKHLKILSSKDQSLGIYTEYFCKKNNISFEFVVQKDMIKRIELLKNKEVDGACMIDPFTIPFIDKGYKLVYEGKNHKDNYTCWAFKKEYVENNLIDVLNFHKSLNEAANFWNNLDKDDKLKYAHSVLDFDKTLDDYYKNLYFNQDKEYDENALKNALKWKLSKTDNLKKEYKDVILKWKEIF